ncbi:NAD-dependent protein deacylase (Regulatory protein SIR2 homolog) [Durusdinium trenchii]
MAKTVRIPMSMSDSSGTQHMIEVPQPVTLQGIKEAAGKKFKDFRPKKGLAYHSFTGEELTEDLVTSLFSGVGTAGVVLCMKTWKGAAKLKASAAAGYRSPLPCEGASQLQRAAMMLQECEVLLVLVGAGMGVDSGLSTFRAKDGSYTKEEYMDLARHQSFREDIEKAWRWHGAMLETFRQTPPHAGYGKLLELCRRADFFVCTSNIDGAFLRAGFPPERLFEAHGSVHMWQCCDPKCNRAHPPWPAQATMELPQCRHCEDYARPNVAFFDDDLGSNARTFNPKYIEPQRARFHRWLASLAGRQVCVLEIGCGSSEHSLRMRWTENSWCCMSGEWKIPRLACPLVRLDPGEAEEVEEGHLGNLVHLLLGARDALEQLSVELGGATRADAVE